MPEAKFININEGYERVYFKIGEHFFLCLQLEGKEVICYDCNNEENEPSDKLNATKIFFMGYQLGDNRISDFIKKNNEIYSKNDQFNNAVNRLWNCMFGLSIEQQLKFIENGESVSVCLKNYDDETIEKVVTKCKKELEAAL